MLNNLFCWIAILLWILLAYLFHKERSRYRNCYVLFCAIVCTVIALTFTAGEYQGTVILILFIITVFALLILPVFLIINGVMMFRREGHSLSNLLSFAFGILIGLGEVATYIVLLGPGTRGSSWEAGTTLPRLSRLSLFFSVSVIYISFSFVVFMLYCVFLQIIPRKRDFDYVIIHGAGLLQGDRVSKLLADRIDKAIEIYRKDPTPPILIPSGGKGSDEKISEAEAMEKYLLNKGIPAGKILIEDLSATTFENLVNSKKIIDAQEGRKYTALVTSNYHVYRALRYCRKIGLKCIGIGSHVAFYYWPSALIREYIAVHAEKRHLVMLIAGWVLCMVPCVWIYFMW